MSNITYYMEEKKMWSTIIKHLSLKSKITVFTLISLFTLPILVQSAFAQSLKEVPRERTVIFDIDGGRVPNWKFWNPLAVGWRGDNGFHQCVIESLFYFDPMTGKTEPWLATGYEFNKDFTEVTIKIRKGVKWSDGVPFTARDVVFTCNTLLKYAPKLNYSADLKARVKQVRALDDYRVHFILKKPDPRFVLQIFTVKIWGALYIVPEHIWKDVDPLTFQNYDLEKGWPVFTGPYRLVSASETQFIYDRRDDWWAAEIGFHKLPEPERLIWIWPGAEEIRAEYMARNKIDSLMDITRGTFEVLKTKNPNVIAWFEEPPYAWYPAGCPRYIGLNNQIPPWNDPDIRRAVSYAINRDEVIRVAYEGTSVPARFIFPAYPALEAYLNKNKDLFEKYPVEYNPDKAIEIFKQKGFTRGDDGIWRMPDGKRLELTIVTPAPWIEIKKIPMVIIEQLRRVGIDAVMKILEVSPWSDAIWTGQADSWVLWCCGSVADPWESLDHYHSRWVRPLGERQFNNAARWVNKEYDAIVDKIGALPPGDPRIEPLFRQALEIWLKNLPVIPVSMSRKLIPFNTTYWVGWPTAKNVYYPPTWCANGGHFVILNLKPTSK